MHNQSYKRVIIIGGSGLIGKSLHNTIKKKNIEVVSTYNGNKQDEMKKFNLCEDNINNVLKDIDNNDIVVILSAYTNPSWIFKNKDEAFQLNVKYTKKLIDDLIPSKCKICFMSSVEVFDGSKSRITENSKPQPLNYYGKTKYEVEKYLKDHSSNYQIIRTGWNVGIDKKSRCVVSMTYETLMESNAQMAEDNTFTITHVDDLVNVLSNYIFKDHKIIHICSPEIITRIKLADTIINNSVNGKKMNYKKTIFSKIPYSEKRSKSNNLDSEILTSLDKKKFRKAEMTIIEKIKFIDTNLN